MTETKTRTEKLDKLREIIKAVDFCMLTTVDEHGDLHSRPMSNNRDVEFDGDLWFFTYGLSHKADEVGRIPNVNVSFADVGNHQYVSMTDTLRVEDQTGRYHTETFFIPPIKPGGTFRIALTLAPGSEGLDGLATG